MAKKTTRKKVRGKGKSIHDRISEGLDRICLDIVRNGQVVEDPKTGKLIRVTPSAAMLTAIGARVKHTKRDRPAHGTPAQSLRDEAARRGLSSDGPAGRIGPDGLGFGRDA